MLKLTALCVLVAVATCVSAQSCADPSSVINFNTTAFAGVWFDQAHTQRGTGLQLKCDLVKFVAPSNNKLTFNSFSYSSATKQIISTPGEAEVLSNSGKLKVNIPTLNLNSEVRVLSTDYATFAVLWACNAGNARSLVLTRDKHPSTTLLNAGLKVLENNNVSKKELSYSTQHKCHDYNLQSTEALGSSVGTASSMGSLLSVSAPQTASSTPSTTTAASSTSKGLGFNPAAILKHITG